MSPASIPRGGGHSLYVRDWGAGPPVVLMAGSAMDGRIWGETMLHLNAAGVRTIAYDRRGHGRSTDWGDYGFDALADDLAAVIDELDVTDATLVAHSGAGGEAIRYLTRHGAGRVTRLVLVGATGPRVIGEGGVTAAMVDALCDQLTSDMSGWLDANVEPFAPGTTTRINEWMTAMVLDCSRRAVVDFQRTIATEDLTEEAATLSGPVTIIHGTADVAAPIDLTARRYAALITDSELLVYDGVAHGVMVTHAQRLAADIAKRVTEGVAVHRATHRPVDDSRNNPRNSI